MQSKYAELAFEVREQLLQEGVSIGQIMWAGTCVNRFALPENEELDGLKNNE